MNLAQDTVNGFRFFLIRHGHAISEINRLNIPRLCGRVLREIENLEEIIDYNNILKPIRPVKKK